MTATNDNREFYSDCTVSLDLDLLVINIRKPSGEIYEIDLERARNEAEILHWLLHMKDKSWVSVGLLGAILLAFEKAGEAVFPFGLRAALFHCGPGQMLDWKNGKVSPKPRKPSGKRGAPK